MTLSAHDLTLAHGTAAPVLNRVSLTLPEGRVTTLIGANGSGKSTLLRALAGLMAPRAGEVRLGGQPLAGLSPPDRARRFAILPQNPAAPEGIGVAELVMRGRTPHLRRLRPPAPADHAAVGRALQDAGIADLAGRRLDQLSGGQRQRVWLAMALAQETPILLLDEPTTWLDLSHQIELLKLVRVLNREHGRTIGMVLHELSLAARFSDHLVALAGGGIVAQGPPAEVLTPALLARVFGLQATVIADPIHACPLILPH